MRGNFKSRNELLKEAIEVAKEIVSRYPIIFFCKDDQECAELAQNFADRNIFGEETDVSVLLSILTRIINI